MARGYAGAFGRKLNAPYVWIPLCLLFLAPFVDLRRPFRLLHLDLLVLLALRRLARVLQPRRDRRVGAARLSGARSTCSRACCSPASGRARARRAARAARAADAARGGARVPDRVPDRPERGGLERDRRGLRGRDRRRPDRRRRPALRRGLLAPTSSAATPTGRSTTCSTCRSSRRCRGAGAGTTCRRRTAPRSPSTCSRSAGCCCSAGGCGRAARARRSAWRSAYAWAAYPYTAFVLESNSNDTLVALALRGRAARRDAGARPRVRGAATARGGRPRRGREVRDRSRWRRCSRGARRVVFARRCSLAGAGARGRCPFVPDGGLRELYDRTIGYQASRPSPFSIWGQVESLGWLQTVVKAAAAGARAAGRRSSRASATCARWRRSARPS